MTTSELSNWIKGKLCEHFVQNDIEMIDRVFDDAVSRGEVTEDCRNAYYMACLARRSKPEFVEAFGTH